MQAAGTFPPGVPFCLEHEMPDVGQVSRASDARRAARRLRPGLLESAFDRWQRRLVERLIGPALPVVAVLLLLSGAVRVAARFPRSTGCVLAAGGCWWLLEAYPRTTLALVALVAVALEVLALCAPQVFRQQVTLRLLALWRCVVVYRRLWSRAMYVAELEHRDVDGALHVPRLARLRPVRCLDTVDVVRVRARLGQRFDEWDAAGPMLAHVFGATDVRVHRGDDRRLTLELVRGRRGRRWLRGRLELAP